MLSCTKDKPDVILVPKNNFIYYYYYIMYKVAIPSYKRQDILVKKIFTNT